MRNGGGGGGGGSSNRRSYANYYPSDYSGGYEYSKYETRQRSSTNNNGNYSLSNPPPRSTYGLNGTSSSGFDLDSRLSYSGAANYPINGSGLNSKYSRDYSGKQQHQSLTCSGGGGGGYASPSYSNASNSKSSKYLDEYHSHYQQRHRSSSSERSLIKNTYHNNQTKVRIPCSFIRVTN